MGLSSLVPELASGRRFCECHFGAQRSTAQWHGCPPGYGVNGHQHHNGRNIVRLRRKPVQPEGACPASIADVHQINRCMIVHPHCGGGSALHQDVSCVTIRDSLSHNSMEMSWYGVRLPVLLCLDSFAHESQAHLRRSPSNTAAFDARDSGHANPASSLNPWTLLEHAVQGFTAAIVSDTAAAALATARITIPICRMHILPAGS